VAAVNIDTVGKCRQWLINVVVDWNLSLTNLAQTGKLLGDINRLSYDSLFVINALFHNSILLIDVLYTF